MLKLSVKKPASETAKAVDPARPACLEQLRCELSCAICLDICFEPSTTSCGHSFCRECLLSVLQKCGPRCPKCRQQLAGEMVKSCPINTVLWNTIQLLFPTELAVKVEELPAKVYKPTVKANNPTVEQNPNSTQRSRTGTENHSHVDVIRSTSSSSNTAPTTLHTQINIIRPEVIRRTSAGAATRISNNVRNGSSSSTTTTITSNAGESTSRTSRTNITTSRLTSTNIEVEVVTRPSEGIIIRQTRQSSSTAQIQTDSNTRRRANLATSVGDQTNRSISTLASSAAANLRAVRYRSSNRS